MPGPQTQPANIHVGRGDLYIDVTIPATPPVALTGGIPATGRYLGATLAPAEFVYRPTTLDIMTQQSTLIAGYVIVSEDARLNFTIGELIYANDRDLLIGATDQGTYITFGGNVIPATHTCLLVAPTRGGTYKEVMLYTCVFAEDRTYTYARERETQLRVVARAQQTAARVQGDQGGFVHESVVSG